MAERIQISTEVTTGVDHQFVTPAQHGEDGGTQRASGRPDVQTLSNALKNVSDWHQLGIQLGIPTSELKTIEEEYQRSGRRKIETLDTWLQRTPSASWNDVVSALQQMGENTVAESVRHNYIGEVAMMAASTPQTSKQTSISSQKDLCASTSSTVSDDVFTSSASVSPRPSSSSQREGSQKLLFGCGCGKCTFASFIESGCPNPSPSDNSFPYLNIGGLTKEQQQDLTDRLRSESRQIMWKFQHVVSVAMKSLMKREVTVDELLSRLTILAAFDPVKKEPLSLNCYADLMKAETIPKVFIALSNYFSFFNYDIIDQIITELGTEEDKQELQKYKDDFKLYAKRRIYECSSHFGPVSEMGHADIIVKVDSHYETYTVQELRDFRKRLSEILHISSVLRLCLAEKGCFQLTFQVPSFVQQRIFPLSTEQERDLASIRVIKLTCGDYQFVAKGEEDESEPKDTDRSVSSLKPGITSRPEPGQLSRVEHYSDLEFMEKVGGGGYGTVWKGRWISRDKIVAIKTLIVFDEREVRILSSLNHPSIIQYYGTVEEKALHFIVTEFAENGSVYDYIHVEHKDPSLDQRMLWAKEVVEGMFYLHHQDIIHRDLKSSNVLLTSELKAKICDLGSARTLEHTTQQSTAIGTFAWMAPEMIKRMPVSKSCDVYSFGIFLWELITQQQPFSDVFPKYLVMNKVADGEHPPIPETCEWYLVKLLNSCWQMEAKARPSFEEILSIMNKDTTLSDATSQPSAPSSSGVTTANEVELERHLAALELAMREKGSLEKTIMQCVFVGPPRSGKSSLMKRIVGERPTPSSPSTGVADKVVQVEIVRSSTAAASVSGSTWVKLSHDDEAVTVVMDTSQSYSGQTAHSETHSQASVAVAPVNQTELNTTTLVSSVPEQRNQPQPHQFPSPATASTQPHLPSPSSSASTNTTDLKPSATNFCKNALQRNPSYAVRASQQRGWMVYLTDTGGQIEFQEVLPLLVSGPSVFFLVFRLDHDLNKQFMVEYVRSTGATSEPYQSNFTVKEALFQSLASIASMGTYVSRGEQVPLRSKVFFVGTHKDKVSQEQIDCIDRSLQQLVRSTGLYRKGIIQNASKDRMLLAVNNLSDDNSDVQLVRAAVERVGSQGDFKVRAPPSWLIFSLTIRQHKERVLSYEQCFEVARECGIETREELNEALWFLHTKVGLIRYFQGEGLEDFEKIVIVDPQVIFDMNTDLVVETFTFSKVGPAIQEDFKKKGIFPFSTFKRISGSSEQLLTPSRLVKLLEHLHIIAPLEEEEDGERRYFMPCVLAHTMPAEPATSWFVQMYRTIRAFFVPSYPSLLIGFRCGYCPKGLFAALVVYLLANTKCCFQWVLQRHRIFRDQISFSVGPYDTVTITIQPKFLEITCTPASSHKRHLPLATTCGEVRRYIERGIREVTSALHYTSDAAHYLAFYCPGDYRGPDQREPHPAEIHFHGGVPCTLRCELAEEKTFRLPPGHEMWFTEGSECSGRQQQGRQSPGETALPSPPPPSSTAATGSGTAHPRIGDRPEMWQLQRFVGVGGRLVRVVENVCADWEKLALALQFRGGVIRAVRESERPLVEPACRRILERWSVDGEGRQPVTWETLVECLEDIGHFTLASDLRRELEP